MPTTANSTQVKEELKVYEERHKALLEELKPLDSELLVLTATVATPTPEQSATISSLKERINNLHIQLTQLSTKESALVASISETAITNAAVKETLLKSILISTPLPSKGSVLIVHPVLDSANLIQYLTLTQHLNPYGRKRQCDTDLENLMSVINKDVSHSVGVVVETAKSLLPSSILN